MIGSLSVGPVLFSLVAGARAAAPLASIGAVMSAHHAVTMMVVFLILGAKPIGIGIAGLAAS